MRTIEFGKMNVLPIRPIRQKLLSLTAVLLLITNPAIAGLPLVYEGTTDLSAAVGKTGNLLLDPLDFTIGVDVTGANLGVMLGSANVTIQTGATGNQVGNIAVSDSVSWSSTNTLTLNAFHDIDVNNTISNSGGGSLVLRADMTGTGSGNVFFAGLGHVSLTGGGTASIYYNPPGGYAAPTNYAGYFSGVTPTAFMLVNNVNDLQAINNNLGGAYALSKDIDASATATWNGGGGLPADWQRHELSEQSFLGQL